MKSLDLAALLGVPDLPDVMRRVELALEAAVADAAPSIKEPALRLIRARGKRLRPALVVSIALHQGATVTDRIIAGAVAVELVHIASLVHDDIIDEAATRWNIPTINSQEGLHQAILVGDYLFAQAGVMASGVGASAAAVIGRAITAVCNGESRELGERHNLDRSQERLYWTIQDKTAALIVASCSMGVITADGEQDQRLALERFGQEFGMAFQIVDDVLDLISTPQLMGKPVGSDIQEGVYTLPLILARQGPHAAEVKQRLNDTPALITLLMDGGYVQQAVAQAKQYNQRAAQSLASIPAMAALAVFPDTYLRWALHSLSSETYRRAVLTWLDESHT